ncbi:MAG TPA: hypothetical protein ENK18_09990 [Deltaproteobacteria bacterium]|nr:hypothetical protein [Deltaproteobacteria bacterium]
MEIIPDPIHVALLTAPFLVAVLSLHLILWRPLLDWLEEREGTTTDAYKQADELDRAAEEHLQGIETRLVEARREANSLRQAARARALAKEAEILAAARSRAEDQLNDAITKIDAEQQEARTTLQQTAAELSSTIAARVLGRELP